MKPLSASFAEARFTLVARTNPSVLMDAISVHEILNADTKSPGEVKCVGSNMMHIACDIIRPTKNGKR
jgi:hypothetical protein